MVDILVNINPHVFQDFVRYENEKNIYVEMKKAVYRMLQASLLYYKKSRKNLEGIRFKIHPYNPCVATRIVNKKQHTVTWHVDNLN